MHGGDATLRDDGVRVETFDVARHLVHRTGEDPLQDKDEQQRDRDAGAGEGDATTVLEEVAAAEWNTSRGVLRYATAGSSFARRQAGTVAPMTTMAVAAMVAWTSTLGVTTENWGRSQAIISASNGEQDETRKEAEEPDDPPSRVAPRNVAARRTDRFHDAVFASALRHAVRRGR